MRMINRFTLAVMLLAGVANAGAQTNPAAGSPALAVGRAFDDLDARFHGGTD